MQRDDATVLDILKAARLSRAFLGGLSREELGQDLKTQSSILHQLLVVGEAVKRLSDTFRGNHPRVAWREFAGLRDVLIHQYDDVDLDAIWKTLTVDIPILISYLEKDIPSTPKAGDDS
jgi:uncharacterized protein with HEPN domain